MEKILTKITRFGLSLAFVVVLSALALVEILGLQATRRNTSRLVVGEVRKTDFNNGVLISEATSRATDSGVRTVAVADDARPIIIRRYLEKYKSPLVDYSDLIINLSKKYGFEYYWIPAIAQQESNLCKVIPEDSHNCWGYGINSKGTLKFDSYELALKSYAEYLKREYFDKGLNTPEKIMKKYCPSSNGSWAYGVNQFINEMETGKL
jgi:hypothetical protein